ncbi:MAG TPA: HD domain-containing protein, partial [Thermoproteales archaeon]|nr:HD domain-containing protein [Thermoproteales archaeon]
VKRVYEENWGKYPPSHDFLHVKRVLRLAEVIGREEGLNSEEMVALRLAVYLHDIAIALTGQKKGHAEKSARIAEEILKEYGVSGETIRCVCEAIREHSWNLNRKPSSRVSAVLQDADRLDALGMIGFARLYTYGSYLNRRFYHEEEPTPVTRRPLENVYTLDHVYTKLIHIPERMNTRTGKIIAEKRLNRLKKAVEDMIKEISGKD